MSQATHNAAEQFAKDLREKDAIIAKAAKDAAANLDSKLASEDKELIEADKATDAKLQDIVGDQKQLESEHALFAGTMTPEQVNEASTRQ